MASKKEKKDATTSTRRTALDGPGSDSDSDSYYTAEGSAQSIETPPETPEAELQPLPWQQAPASRRGERPAEPTPEQRPGQSIFSNRSVSPSVFGEDVHSQFNEEFRRPTIEWPPSGCIHIPLRPNDARRSTEASASTNNEGSDTNLRTVKIKKPNLNTDEDDKTEGRP